MSCVLEVPEWPLEDSAEDWLDDGVSVVPALLEDSDETGFFSWNTEPTVSSPPDAEHAAKKRAKELMHQNRGILNKFIIVRLLL